MFLIAFISLSAVPDLCGELSILSATKTSCGGIISLSAWTEIIHPLSSVKVDMSINASSKDVSLRSAIEVALLATEPPPAKG